jgi:hypothetical protein
VELFYNQVELVKILGGQGFQACVVEEMMHWREKRDGQKESRGGLRRRKKREVVRS